MGDVIFDTVKKGGRREGRSCWLCDVQRFFPELCSPSAGEEPALCASSPRQEHCGVITKKGGEGGREVPRKRGWSSLHR